MRKRTNKLMQNRRYNRAILGEKTEKYFEKLFFLVQFSRNFIGDKNTRKIRSFYFR